MQPHPGAHSVQAIDQPLLVGPDELFVDLRADQRRGRIAHADQVRAGFHLHPAELQPQGQDEFEQVADEGRIVKKVGHQAIDAAQVGGLGAGPLDPALDEFLAADTLAEEGRGLHAIVHPPAAQRIGHFEPAEHALVDQERSGFIHRGGLVVEIMDRRPAVGGLAAGIGDGRYVIEIELLGRTNLRLDHHPMIHRVLPVGSADLIGGEHHGDGHQRHGVDGLPVEEGENALVTGHGRVSLLNGWQSEQRKADS